MCVRACVCVCVCVTCVCVCVCVCEIFVHVYMFLCHQVKDTVPAMVARGNCCGGVHIRL